MRIAERGDTGRSVAASQFPFVMLSCMRCPRRVVVKPDHHSDLDREIWTWKLKCSCGNDTVQRYIAEDETDQAGFFNGKQPRGASHHQHALRSEC